MGSQFQIYGPEAFEAKDEQRDRRRVFANWVAEGIEEHLAQSDRRPPQYPQAIREKRFVGGHSKE
jgi:hypothetical protein